LERGVKGEKQFAISITGSTYLQASLALLLSLLRLARSDQQGFARQGRSLSWW